MKDLVFSECAKIAGPAFFAGCFARNIGMKLMDDAEHGKVDNILSVDKLPPVPHSPLRSACLLTGSLTLFGAYLGIVVSPYATDDNEKAALLPLFMLESATVGVCFSIGARAMFEYSKRCLNNEINSMRQRSAPTLV